MEKIAFEKTITKKLDIRKGYEIVSFKYRHNKSIATVRADGKYSGWKDAKGFLCKKHGSTLLEMVWAKDWKIYSVRRVKDGIEFPVVGSPYGFGSLSKKNKIR